MHYDFENPKHWRESVIPPPDSIKRWERKKERRRRKELHDEAVKALNKKGQRFAGLSGLILKLSMWMLFLWLLHLISQRVS
jgi:hypothetical protein